MISINLTSVMVDDQAKALAFYTDKLGFVLKDDVPVGDDRWLTVVSPAAPDGVQLLLEPTHNPALDGASESYQRTLYEAGVPAASFAVDDIHQEHERMRALDVAFTQEPTDIGPVLVAVLDDTCGNLIQLVQG